MKGIMGCLSVFSGLQMFSVRVVSLACLPLYTFLQKMAFWWGLTYDLSHLTPTQIESWNEEILGSIMDFFPHLTFYLLSKQIAPLLLRVKPKTHLLSSSMMKMSFFQPLIISLGYLLTVTHL